VRVFYDYYIYTFQVKTFTAVFAEKDQEMVLYVQSLVKPNQGQMGTNLQQNQKPNKATIRLLLMVSQRDQSHGRPNDQLPQ